MQKAEAKLVSFVGTILFLISLLNGFAQVNKGSIIGVVRDPSGGMVPGAEVRLVETGTQITYTAVTGEGGGYNFTQLPQGTYSLSVELPGFRRYVQSGIRLTSAAAERIDVTLEVGEVSETVEVLGRAPLIEQRKVEYSVVEETETLAKLPLPMGFEKRTPTSYLTTIPGYQAGAFGLQIQGSLQTYSELMVDGAPATWNAVSGESFRGGFSAEALGEFKVVTNNASAEYGRTGGIVISYTTKSGTNAFRGSLYEYVANDAFDARSFFARNRAINKKHDFGGSLGGPIVKDRTFFFSTGGSFSGVTAWREHP